MKSTTILSDINIYTNNYRIIPQSLIVRIYISIEPVIILFYLATLFELPIFGIVNKGEVSV